MLGEFHSRKDSQSPKFKRRPQIIVKLNFREFCDSKLSGLHAFDNMAITEFKYIKNRMVGCEFIRHQMTNRNK